MVARKGRVSTLMGRWVKVSGEYHVDGGSGAVTLRDSTVTNKRTGEVSPDGKLYAGETYVIELNEVETTDRILFIQFSDALYDAGIVSGPSIVGVAEGPKPVWVRVELDEDLDISELEFIARFYIDDVV